MDNAKESVPLGPTSPNPRPFLVRPYGEYLSPTSPAPTRARASPGQSPSISSNYLPNARIVQQVTPVSSDSSSYLHLDPSKASGNRESTPRLSRTSNVHRPRHSARACENCRKRKIKCDSNRPTCGQCVHLNKRCLYEDAKQVRDRKTLQLLSQYVDRYEALLRDLESEVDAPTAQRIRDALKARNGQYSKPSDADDSDSSSVGSLEAVDLVEEDLNRSEITRATGYFGKNSEVSWLQSLEHRIESSGSQEARSPLASSQSQSPSEMFVAPGLNPQGPSNDISIALMNYHLDDLEIPPVDGFDPFILPPNEVADKYLNAYITFVHPFFNVIQKSALMDQYRKSDIQPTKAPRKWLGILNIVFAIGCRHYRYTSTDNEGTSAEDLMYFSRARQLCLNQNYLLEHPDVQTVQLELLVAVYLLCLGQVNRASKFSSMALRSAISLGINLRLIDNDTQNASKEARCRLWWSIYSLEHLLTSMLGRASCIDENICSAPFPIPLEEESFRQQEVQDMFLDYSHREAQLRPTLFETSKQLQVGPSWAGGCEPSPALFFYYIVDLTLISQAVLSRVYSIEGIREGTSLAEYRLEKYSLHMDRWLSKLPPSYEFTEPNSGPWHVNYARLDDEAVPFTRERICLAMSFYSAQIILYRPCLTQTRSSALTRPNKPKLDGMKFHAKHRTEMAASCIQAACSLISIFPENVDVNWLTCLTPWWSVLHFLMQGITVLLLSLSEISFSSYTKTMQTPNRPPSTILTSDPSAAFSSSYPSLADTDFYTALSQAKKALTWVHSMSSIDPAAYRAFLLCDGIVKKIAPRLNIDLHVWPNAETLPSGLGDKYEQVLDRWEDWVDFDGEILDFANDDLLPSNVNDQL